MAHLPRNLRHCPGLTAAVLLTAAVAFAQPVARVTVGSPVLTMTPDLEVPVPINVNAPGGGLLHVEIEIAYPAKLLKYVEAKPGSVVERAKGKVRVEGKAGNAAAGEQVLAIAVESPEPLTAGTLVTLWFQPTEAVTGRTEIPLRTLSRSAKSAAGEEIEPQGADGKITLMPIVFSCFFYMH